MTMAAINPMRALERTATMGLTRALELVWKPLARCAAHAYVAGPALSDAVAACEAVASRGLATTIGFWDGGEPLSLVADQHLRALDAIARQRLDCYLSIKAPALGFSDGLVRELGDRSRRLGIRLHFDALGPESVRPTFALVEAVLADHPDLGCTLPARWRRSLADAETALALGLTVRLVKGEEPGPDDIDPRRGLLALVDRVAGRARRVAVATHDSPVASEALARLRAAGTPAESELLLGLPLGPPLAAARGAGVPARLYVPYGHSRLPYRLSEAGARPAVLWWAVRDLAQDGMRRLGSARHPEEEASGVTGRGRRRPGLRRFGSARPPEEV